MGTIEEELKALRAEIRGLKIENARLRRERDEARSNLGYADEAARERDEVERYRNPQ